MHLYISLGIYPLLHTWNKNQLMKKFLKTFFSQKNLTVNLQIPTVLRGILSILTDNGEEKIQMEISFGQELENLVSNSTLRFEILST